jgi:hypothetical protein
VVFDRETDTSEVKSGKLLRVYEKGKQLGDKSQIKGARLGLTLL